MKVRFTQRPLAPADRVADKGIAAVVAEIAARAARDAAAAIGPVSPFVAPVYYRCAGCGLFYRQTGPWHWEIAKRTDFEHAVRIEDMSRAAIEARGHDLVPVQAVAG